MIKIALATIFYNNKAELQRLVDSIPDKAVDSWITVDGPFRYNLDINPNLSHKSNDGSFTVITKSAYKFNDTIYINYKTGATEFDKRNTYLENCSKLGNIDVLIIVDSDEFFIYPQGITPLAAWQRFRKDMEILLIQNPHHNVYGIPAIEGVNTETYRPRIWVNPGKMRYINNSHYMYANIIDEKENMKKFEENGLIYCQHAAKIIKGGPILAHDQSLRSPEYQKRREDYQRYLVRYEELLRDRTITTEQADQQARDTPKEDFQPT
jgi:hypothetical protein